MDETRTAPEWSGGRIRARGLVWDVLESHREPAGDRLSVRCAEGDLIGLEWELHVPPEPVEPAGQPIDPTKTVPLARWRLAHQACLLSEMPPDDMLASRAPGRITIEPFQLVPLLRALEMPRPRLLLADGVGLGKTVQACLIAVELIARRRAHRILIVAPPGPLLNQWDQETRLRFGLRFTRITSAADLWDLRRSLERGANPFDTAALCLTSLDFAKQDHVLEELERASWDLAIIDEAHHCVAMEPEARTTHRRRLAEVVARRSDGLLLLTATPHDGHDARFASLIELLDPSLVDGEGGFVKRDYRRNVIRRLKAHVRDTRTGAALFRPRRVAPVKVDTKGPDFEPARAFHRALAAFVVPRLRRPGVGDTLAFVSLLKRSVSTIAACEATLRVVADRLNQRAAGTRDTAAARAERTRALRLWRRRTARFGVLSAADEDQRALLEVESLTEALHAEPDPDLARLIAMAGAAAAHDPKLAAAVREIRLIRAEHPEANVLVYTEYTDSQIALSNALRGEIVLTIGGEDSETARMAAAARFSGEENLILISTDSLAEGLNLHARCFHLIHLDLPWNPNRLEQRNGRIDRYGQARDPSIRYLYLPGTFEERLLLHLIAKYEKARAALDVMPDTIGVTADGWDAPGPVTGGLSEDPDDLFQDDPFTIRSIDRAAHDSHPDTIAALVREIDRAWDMFELASVAHAWAGSDRYDQTSVKTRALVRREAADSEDLRAFTAAVIGAVTETPAAIGSDLRVPADWAHGMAGLPGFDAATNILRLSGKADAHAGQDAAFLGRAHPLVARAIRAARPPPVPVAAARHDRRAILLTFEIEVARGGRTTARRMIGILADKDRPPAVAVNILAFARHEARPCWARGFAGWGGEARAAAEELARAIAERERTAIAAQFETMTKSRDTRLANWARTRADLLCGPPRAPTADLFGAAPPGPSWRYQNDPRARLTAFATDPDVPSARRRAANLVLEIWRDATAGGDTAHTVAVRPAGLLMLVPDNA